MKKPAKYGKMSTTQSEKYSQRGKILEDCPSKLTLGTQQATLCAYLAHQEPVAKFEKNKSLFNVRRCWYKIIDSENFIKVSQNPNKVARDTQRLPTVPHNDFGGLNFKSLASKYLILMVLPPADDAKNEKKSYFRYPNFKKRPRILHPRRKFAV